VKKLVVYWLLVLILGFVPMSARALSWDVGAEIFPTEKPRAEDSYVRVRRTHTLSVTYGQYEVVTGIKAAIVDGWAEFDGVLASPNACTTALELISVKQYHLCNTSFDQDPCESGLWRSITKGRLKQGLLPCGACGYKTGLSTSKEINCSPC
jgi:hypothetical protein